MSVFRLIADQWDGVLNHERVVDAPSQGDFDRLLDALDARIYTMITIQAEGEQHMTVGGGAGQYVVYATFDNEEFWNLTRAEPADGTIILNAGGQEGDFPVAQVVEREDARRAGRTFLATGTLDSGLKWVKA